MTKPRGGTRKEWKFYDKSAWGEGPWLNEPDKVQWTDKATGFTCLAVRASRPGDFDKKLNMLAGLGHWCGYVGVPENHPLFGKSYGDVDADVHGGLTFADRCDEQDKEHGICHVGEEKLWWFGFDCAHSGDLSPGTKAVLKKLDESRSHYGDFEEKYRDLNYVKAECANLAAQLAGEPVQS